MKPITSFNEASQYLAGFYANARTKYELDKMIELMNYLDNPQNKFKTIHVAGTSGKTSTSYYASALLAAAGAAVGLTVSPHVDEINERVQVNNLPLSEAEFCGELTRYIEIVAESTIKVSWFEVMVAFAYWYFASQKLDYVVAEVGLGGLKDATNVISRPDKVCVITDIGLDHVNILGSNLAEIARQKAGIIQPGNTVFTYQQPAEVMEVISHVCQEKQAQLNIVRSVSLESRLPDYQQRNWHLARQAVSYVAARDSLASLNDSQLNATQTIIIPGRMDTREIQGKTVVMDGAHNLQKLTAFIQSFEKLYPGAKPAVLISLKEGKEYKETVPLLADFAARVVITTYKSAQDTFNESMDPQRLAQEFKSSGVKADIIEDQAEAVRALLAGNEKICVITGSFYLLSQIRQSGVLSQTT